MKRVILLLAALAGLSMVAPPSAFAQSARPSFDCRAARSPDERAICADARLAELDQAVTIAYKQIETHKENLGSALGMAREALAARRACGSDRLCILDQQASELDAFSNFGSKVPVPPWVGDYRIALFKSQGKHTTKGLPKRVGQCTVSKIASITTRFGEELKPPKTDLDSTGSLVEYANQGAQVSYDYVEALQASRIGDEVLICLVSLPKDCPPGDERGKVYSGTNLRTKGSWIMPDSQHMCGGA
ncbi:MAG TPA: hypothetical protein VG986_18570 [Pseudolabrys sp.]|nr:hypothetical protein [Pseudolabrys sp.]